MMNEKVWWQECAPTPAEKKALKKEDPIEFKRMLMYYQDQQKTAYALANKLLDKFLAEDEDGIIPMAFVYGQLVAADYSAFLSGLYFGMRYYERVFRSLINKRNDCPLKVHYDTNKNQLVVWRELAEKTPFTAFGHTYGGHSATVKALEEGKSVMSINIFDRIKAGLREDYIDPDTHQIWRVKAFISGKTGRRVYVCPPYAKRIIGYAVCHDRDILETLGFRAKNTPSYGARR